MGVRLIKIIFLYHYYNINSMLNFILNCIYNTIFVQAVEVIPQIWLGDCNSAIDYQFLKENDITAIVRGHEVKPAGYEVSNF